VYDDSLCLVTDSLSVYDVLMVLMGISVYIVNLFLVCRSLLGPHSGHNASHDF